MVMGAPESSVRGLRMGVAGVATGGEDVGEVVVVVVVVVVVRVLRVFIPRDDGGLYAGVVFVPALLIDGARKSRYNGRRLAVALLKALADFGR